MIEIFISYFGVLALFSLIVSLKPWQKDLLFYIGLVALIVFDGLRWETGTDWQNYHDGFIDFDGSIPGFEIGFNIYLGIFRTLTSNYSIFLLVTTAFVYFNILRSIYLLTNRSILSILFVIGFLPWYSGALRQMMALAFFTLGVTQLLSGKKRNFYFLMGVASTFHLTSLPFIFLPYFHGISIFVVIIILLILIGFVSLFSSYFILLNTIFSVLSENKAIDDRLISSVENSNFILGFIRKIINIVVPLYLYLKIRVKVKGLNVKDEKNLAFLINCTLISAFFYVIGTFYIEHVSSRLDIYVGIVLYSILIGYLEGRLNKNFKYLLFIFVLFLIFVNYSRLQYIDLFHPYKSIFYNNDYIRNLY